MGNFPYALTDSCVYIVPSSESREHTKISLQDLLYLQGVCITIDNTQFILEICILNVGYIHRYNAE